MSEHSRPTTAEFHAQHCVLLLCTTSASTSGNTNHSAVQMNDMKYADQIAGEVENMRLSNNSLA